MTLVLTEEQHMLRDAAAGFLGGRASPVHLRALRDAGDELAFDPAVWREMVEMGWAGIAIPETYGGLGYGYTGLGVVLEELGRKLSPSPMQGSVLLGATALLTLGDETSRSAWLPRLASGEAQVALAHQETSNFDPRAVAATARQTADGWTLSGHKRLVVDAISADVFVIVARSAGAPGDATGLSTFLVPAGAPGLTVTRSDLVDSRQYGALALEGVALPASALMGTAGDAWPAFERCLDIAAVGFSAELLGVAVEAFERTMAYLRERKQFGRVIGSFQGLQHRAAMLFAELELARSIVLRALHAIDADDEDLSLLASAAKAKLCEVAQLASNEGIQMHGGVGMTDEYDIGFFLKRARVLQHLAGDHYYHLDRFARLGGF